MSGLPQGMSNAQMNQVKDSLESQSAPANPETPSNPADRKDPSQLVMLDFHRVQKVLDALDVSIPSLEETDPRHLFVTGVRESFAELNRSHHLPDAVDVLLERLFPLSSPTLKQRLQSMFQPISPPTGLGGGAQGPGQVPGPNQGPAGGTTGPPPGAGPSGPSASDAGVATLPA